MTLKAGDRIQCIDTSGPFKLIMGNVYDVIRTITGCLIVYDCDYNSVVLIDDYGIETSYMKHFIPYVAVQAGVQPGKASSTQPTTYIYKPGNQLICVKEYASYNFTKGKIYTVHKDNQYPMLYLDNDIVGGQLFCFNSNGEIDPLTSAFEMFEYYNPFRHGIKLLGNFSISPGQIAFNPAQTQLIPRNGYSPAKDYATLKAEKEQYSFSVQQKDTGHNASHEVVENWACGKSFYFCRVCRIEVTK